jgi:septation ring formation regulator EzrA
MEDFNGKLNVVSLKDYVESVVHALEKNIHNRLEQMDKAVCKAEAATEKRFESVNEFRLQLGDQARTFMPRQEYEQAHKNVVDKIEELKTRFDKVENMKQGGNVVWAYVLSAISLIAAIIAIATRFTGS